MKRKRKTEIMIGTFSDCGVSGMDREDIKRMISEGFKRIKREEKSKCKYRKKIDYGDGEFAHVCTWYEKE